ncbi:hypothetical protein KI688_006912 [Linnemannia hyalina]|uniref:Uncharacterized protein n=1 Tax=Linnemannia hyalina TaxID=64524 RepID=A0A9P7XIJ7_9FUNG|nr:hypothetical protein KI688_006912 [Linnemannia hyalina]
MTTADPLLLDATPTTHFQAFRDPYNNDNTDNGDPQQEHILIPVVRHPITNDLYVIWGDITDCFPEVLRVQFKNVFVPMLRGDNLYRVKPFGIRYHPEIVLDVVYRKKPSSLSLSRKSRSRSGQIEDAKVAAAERRATVAAKDAPNQDADAAVAVGDALNQDTDAGLDGPDKKGNDRDKNDGDSENKFVEGEREPAVEEQDAYAVGPDTMLHESAKKSTEQSAKQATKQSTEQAVLPSVPDLLPIIEKEVVGIEEEEEKEELQEHEKTQQQEEQEEQEERNRDQEKEQNHVSEQAETPRSIQWVPKDLVRRETPFTIEELIKHRAKYFFTARYSWANCSSHSRLFFFLPVLTDVPTQTGAASTPEIHNYTKFQLYYLCDCSGIPGAKEHANPHWINNNNNKYNNIIRSKPSAMDISQSQLRELIPLVGDYTMTVLEMFKYGVYVDKVPEEVAQRVSLAIKYLASKGVWSCEGFITEMSSDYINAVAEPMMIRLSPISLLDVSALDELRSKLVRDPSGQYADLYPFRTAEGDVRWTCGRHWMSLWSDMAVYARAITFHQEPGSPEGWYSPLHGVLCSRITTLERALEFFELAAEIPRNPVFTVWLDWDMTLEEEGELSRAIGRLSAAAVHILLRGKGAPQDKIDAGTAFGRLELTTAALQNPGIEMFTLTEADLGLAYNYKEFTATTYHQSYRPKAGERITAVERGEKGGLMAVTVKSVDVDLAIAVMRRIAGGLHRFSELRFEHGHSHLVVKFMDLGGGDNLGYNGEEDTDVTSGDMHSFLDRRGWRDQVLCFTQFEPCEMFFHLSYLAEVHMWYFSEGQRTEVRDLIVLNKHLKCLYLESKIPDFDPSQAYETCKQSLSDHRTIELFQITSPKGNEPKCSSFAWRNPNDLDKMRVDITCNRADHVEAMFQRYAPLIDQLEVGGLSLTDAMAMDKLARRKKRPFSPTSIYLWNIHLIEPAVREILEEVIVNGAMEEVIMRGSVTSQVAQLQTDGKMDWMSHPVKLKANVKIWSEFLVAIRSKVTGLFVEDDPQKHFLRAMESQPAMSLEMPQLTLFQLTCSMESHLFDRLWLDMLLEFKGPAVKDIVVTDDASPREFALGILARRNETVAMLPISNLCLLSVMMTPEDWSRFLRYLDMSQMVQFAVSQSNAMSRATLLQIADAVPLESEVLQRFCLRSKYSNDTDTTAALEAKFGPKSSKRARPNIDLNGFNL